MVGLLIGLEACQSERLFVPLYESNFIVHIPTHGKITIYMPSCKWNETEDKAQYLLHMKLHARK
jgi:hypothetical protein